MKLTALLLCLIIAFWLWMVVDCATNEAPRRVRIAWLLALLTLPPLGPVVALAYYALRMMPRAIGRLSEQ